MPLQHILRFSIAFALALGFSGAAPLAPAPGWLSAAGIAFADDDDGGGDDGGGRGGMSGGGGDRQDDDVRPRGDLRSLFRWPFRQAERPAPRRTAPIPDRAPDEIIASGLGEESIANLVAGGFAVDARMQVALAGGELVRLTIPRGMGLQAARQAVAAEAPSASVDFNHFYRPEQRQARPCGERECTLVRHIVGWPMAENGGTCAAPLPIGLIDTAINAGHDSLAGAHVEVLRLGEDTGTSSTAQHGTAVAALLVGAAGSRTPGLVPAARLVAVDAFQRYRGTADIANAYDLVRALDMLASRGVRVVNLSLSGPANGLLEQAVGASIGKGIILVAAAGNDGPNAKPVYPAAYPDVIAVTAVDRKMNPYRRAVRGDHIDIAAPGVGVWTAASISGARQKNGTSFAAPFVTAAASVLLAANPDMTARQVEDELMRSADDMGAPGKDPVFGWGLLDVRSICATGAPDATGPMAGAD